jgi:hypothetical protein
MTPTATSMHQVSCLSFGGLERDVLREPVFDSESNGLAAVRLQD